MIRLANSSGTKATLVMALITVLGNDNGFGLSPGAISKLGIEDKSRVDVIADPETSNLYIAVVGEKEGRSVSKYGKVASEQIRSWLTDNEDGDNATFEISDETVDFDGYSWSKLNRIKPIKAVEASVATEEAVPVKPTEEANAPAVAADFDAEGHPKSMQGIDDTEKY